MQELYKSLASKTSLTIKEVQQNIEASFNKIDKYLDQIDQIIDDNQKMQNQMFQKYSSLDFSQPDIHNQEFSNQLIVQVTSLMKVSMEDKVKNEVQLFNYELKKQNNKYQLLNQNYEQVKIEKQKLEETIKNKDEQLQSKNSQIQQREQTQLEELNKQNTQLQELNQDQQQEKVEKLQLEENIKNKDQQLEENKLLIQQLEQIHLEELNKINTQYQELIQNYEQEKMEKQKLEETIKNKDEQLQSKNSENQQLTQIQIQRQQLIAQQSVQSILNPLSYDLIENNSIKQHNWCYAIAINKDCSVLIVGSDKQIKVFEFKLEVLKQTQLLSDHEDDVLALNFMNKSNQFISGSEDKSIIIWSLNQSNQWICLQKLMEHNNWIYCLELNNNEDLIISGSGDNTIKFWQKQNQWILEQTISDHGSSVLGLSLNQTQNRVISCGYDAQILVIEQQQNTSKWIVIQKIKVETLGRRICFINDNLFTFQPDGKEFMHVYEINNTNNQYQKTKAIVVKGGSDQCFFPQQFIKQRRLLVNRNGNYVNFIRIKENGEFNTEYSIEFENMQLYGCMSNDGLYLVTWDSNSKEIQIRKSSEI